MGRAAAAREGELGVRVRGLWSYNGKTGGRNFAPAGLLNGLLLQGFYFRAGQAGCRNDLVKRQSDSQ